MSPFFEAELDVDWSVVSVSEAEISDVAPHGECLLYLPVHHLPWELLLCGVFRDTVGEGQGPPSVSKMISRHYHVSQNGITFILLLIRQFSQMKNYFLFQDIHLLGVRRLPPSLAENISIMSRRKKLSNAENLFTLLLCCWWLPECEADIRSIWKSKIKSGSLGEVEIIISHYFSQFILFLTSIGFLYLTLMSPTRSFTPHLFS